LSPAASPESKDVSRPSFSRSDTTAIIVVTLVYIAVQITLAVGHTLWRDEAQAWLWAQSLSAPIEFLIIPGEGHPPIWYWLLRTLSIVFDFNQARYFTLGVAILNAILLARLLRAEFLLLSVLLCSYVLLQYWGYHFRPYGLVFTALLTALLLERNGRAIAATWVMTLACGLHFFAGFLFGFWLLMQWRRGIPVIYLAGPAALGALFGASALLSGMGNPESAADTTDLFESIAYNLAWPLTWPALRIWPAAILSIALICYGLWKDRFTLVVLLTLTLAFALGAAAVYGQSPWHTTFMMMMVLMAFIFAGPLSRRWVLIVLLAPQAIVGISMAKHRLENPVWTRPDLYAVVAADAGPDFDPARQLIGWQDFNLSTAAAAHHISYISGNNGTVLGPVDWRHRVEEALDPILVTTPTPYWLVCGECDTALDRITAAGLTPTELTSAVNFDDGPQSAYRID
jgi:hypothetical protein